MFQIQPSNDSEVSSTCVLYDASVYSPITHSPLASMADLSKEIVHRNRVLVNTTKSNTSVQMGKPTCFILRDVNRCYYYLGKPFSHFWKVSLNIENKTECIKAIIEDESTIIDRVHPDHLKMKFFPAGFYTDPFAEPTKKKEEANSERKPKDEPNKPVKRKKKH
jgi:hypothetical protein